MYRFLQRVATLAWRLDERPRAGAGDDRLKRQGWLLVLSAGTLLWTSGYLYAQRATERKGWTPGKGYGWVWGRNDEVGALNTLGPDDVRRAMSLVRQGKVYDMGVTYDRSSYKWP